MRKFACLLVCLSLAALLPAWEKQGTVSGNIADVEVISWDGNSGLIYIATRGSGIWKTTDGGQTWSPANGSSTNPLPDLNIKAICAEPNPSTGYPNPNNLLAISSFGVYRTTNQGASWSVYETGLASTPAKGYLFMDIAAGYSGSSVLYHLATYGGGTYRKIGTGSWTFSTNGNMFDNSDLYCLCIAANGTKALVGTELNPQNAASGHLYTRVYGGTDSWVTYSSTSFPQSVSVRALSFRFPDYVFAAVGQDALPVPPPLWVSPGGSGFPNFSELSGSGTAPTDEILSIDYYYDPLMSSDFMGVVGTTQGLWTIPDPASPSNQFQSVPFVGAVTGVGVGNPEYCFIFFGGPGKGPFLIDCPFTNRPYPIRGTRNSGNDIGDYQAVDLAPSRYCGTAGTTGEDYDYDLFAASGIAGLFKNQKRFDAETGEQGYFTRMIGDPSSDGVPEVTCVGASNNYERWKGGDTGGSVGHRQLTVFVGTDGKGVLKSVDGGRSWYNPNTGAGTLPLGKRISALVLSPNYGSDQDLYAAIYDPDGTAGGVWRSLDGGQNWYNISGATLLNKRVTALGIAPNYSGGSGYIYAGCRYDGSNNTAWRFNGSSWSALGTFTYDINSLAVPTYNKLFAGTAGYGVWHFNSDQWVEYNTGFPYTTGHVYQVKAAPGWSALGDPLLAAVRPWAGTTNGGFYWYKDTMGWQNYNTGLPDNKVLSVAFSPDFAANNRVYCGHAFRGVYANVLDPAGGLGYNWLGAAGFYTTPEKVNGVAVDPADPNIVMASTQDMGVFLSIDGGYTFRPWSRGLIHLDGYGKYRLVETTRSALITPIVSGTQRRALCGTEGQFIYYANFNPESGTPATDFYYPLWTRSTIGTVPAPPTTGKINEIRSVGEEELLREAFNSFPSATWARVNGGASGQWGPNPAKNCSAVPVTSPLSGGVALMDNTCSLQYGAQNDELISPVFLTSTQGIASLTLEFDHQYWDIASGKFTDFARVRVRSYPTGPWSNVAGALWDADEAAGHVSLDLTSYLRPDMQVEFLYYSPAAPPAATAAAWMVDNVVITANQGEDLRAADTLNGDWGSDDLGLTWWVVDPDLAGIGLTDMNFKDGGMTPWGRGKPSFVWGVSSGLTLGGSFRSGTCNGNGAVWKYTPDLPTGDWAACSTTGLDTCEDYRAVLKTDAGPILVGSIDMGGGTSWAGLYRSDDDCATWVESNYGLPDNPRVWALQEVPGGDLLVGIVDSYLDDGNQGGVYLSDAQSGGRAWVLYSAGFTPAVAGTVELTGDGSSVYTGMEEDGVYSGGDTISYYNDDPLALFETTDTACVGSSVAFTDRSAGKPTSWSWNFGDTGSSTDQNPTHTYASAGTYYPQLTASSFYGSSLYTLPSPGLAIVDELDLGDGLRLVKQAYAISFGADDGGFTATGLWHRTSACSAGSTVFYYGQDDGSYPCTYNTGVANSGTLTSPAISLAGMTGPVLSFRYRLETEGFSGFDIARVRLSDDGALWTNLDADADNGGTLIVDNAWHTASYDISAYGDGTLYIQFTFSTVDATNNAYLGFMVDDITVTAPEGLMMTWDDLDGESGYQVFTSNSPASGTLTGAEFPACTESPCSGVPADTTKTYYRLRVEGVGYACGDGPVGGNW